MNKMHAPDDIIEDLKPKVAAVEQLDASFAPPAVMDWLVDLHERVGIPLDYLAASCVVTAGAVIGRQLGISPNKHSPWLVIANLWGVIIGEPATMKSPGLEQGARLPLDKLEDILQQQNQGRLYSNDCTPEALARLLSENPRGILVFRDEISGLFLTFTRKGYENFRAFFLESWNGNGSYQIDRVGKGRSVNKVHACCSILGSIQPDVMAKSVEKIKQGDEPADGFLQRFQLMVWPDQTYFEQVDRAPDYSARKKFDEFFERILKIDVDSIQQGEVNGVPIVKFSAEAQEKFTEWHKQWRKWVRSCGKEKYIVSHFEKYSSLVPALSLIFYMVDGGTGPVGVKYLDLALRWLKYLKSHALKVYGDVANPEREKACLIVKTLQVKPFQDKFTVRDLTKKHWAGLKKPEEVTLALELLVDKGYCDLEIVGKKKFYVPKFSTCLAD